MNLSWVWIEDLFAVTGSVQHSCVHSDFTHGSHGRETEYTDSTLGQAGKEGKAWKTLKLSPHKRGNPYSHLCRHNETNACYSIPRSQTSFIHWSMKPLLLSTVASLNDLPQTLSFCMTEYLSHYIVFRGKLRCVQKASIWHAFNFLKLPDEKWVLIWKIQPYVNWYISNSTTKKNNTRHGVIM